MLFEPSLQANIWFSLAIFVGLLIVLHILLIYVRPLGDIGWKRVDYIWLSFASLSLVTAVTQDRRVETQAAYEFTKPVLTFADDDILREAKFDRHYRCDLPLQRSEYSPPNFDWIVEQDKLACAWFKKAVTALELERKKERPEFKPELISDDTRITNKDPRDDIRELYKHLAAAQAVARKQDQWNAMANFTDFDITLIRLSPILLAFALALRITKVTGELRLARTRMAKAA